MSCLASIHSALGRTASLRRQVFRVGYPRLVEVIGDQDVALPAIDLGGERPTGIAGDGENTPDAIARDREWQSAETMHATIGKAVEVQGRRLPQRQPTRLV